MTDPDLPVDRRDVRQHLRDVETSAADAHQCLGPAYADTTRPETAPLGPGDLAAQVTDLRRQLLEARAQRAATRRLWLAGLEEARRAGATPATVEAALTGELQQATEPGGHRPPATPTGAPMAAPANPAPGDVYRLEPDTAGTRWTYSPGDPGDRFPWLEVDVAGNRNWLPGEELPTGLTLADDGS